MKKISNKILIIFALVLCLSVSVGVSLAYFSDYEEASGGATLNLGGKTKMSEGESSNEKNIVITNTGETNMIVRVGIYGPDEMAEVTSGGKWLVGDDGFYYYGEILKPGQSTEKDTLVSSMKFKWKGEEPDYEFEVTVVHEGSQALYDGDTLLCPGCIGYAGLKEEDPNHWDPDTVALIKEGE